MTDLAFVHKFVRSVSDSVSSKRAIGIDITAPNILTMQQVMIELEMFRNNQTITVAVGDTLTFNLNYGASASIPY